MSNWTPAQIEAAARAVDAWTAERLDFVLSSDERDSLAVAALTAAAQVQPWRCPATGPHGPHDWRVTPEFSQRCAGRLPLVNQIPCSKPYWLITADAATTSQPEPEANEREALQVLIYREYPDERTDTAVGFIHAGQVADAVLAVVAKHRDAEVERLLAMAERLSEQVIDSALERDAAQDRIARALAVLDERPARNAYAVNTIRAILEGRDG